MGMKNLTHELANTTEYAKDEVEKAILDEAVTFLGDDYGVWTKVILTLISVVFITFATSAIAALNRTRSTPKIARFLSSWLLIYDTLAVLFFAIRRLTDDPYANITMQIFGVLCCWFAYVTIGMMALERYLVFKYPYFYLKHLRASKVKRIVYTIWTVLFIIYFFSRIGLCFLLYDDVIVHDLVGKCNTAPFMIYAVTLVCTITGSSIYYITIFMIVRSKSDISNKPQTVVGTMKTLKNYKSTSIVFVYILTIFVVTITYTLIIVFKLKNPGSRAFRIPMDFLNMFNSLLDPFVYVLWFRECRMELLKMNPCPSQKALKNIECMRMEIYNIVTMEDKCSDTRSISNISLQSV